MTITCIGDCGVDAYIHNNSIRPGGITLNFAVHARKVFPLTDVINVISAIGDDENSHIVLDTIRKYKLVSHIKTFHGKTPVQYIDIDKSGEKLFVKYEEGILKDFTIDAKLQTIIERSDFVSVPIYWQIEKLFKSVMESTCKGIVGVDFMDLSDYGKQTAIVEKYIEKFDIGFFGLQSNEKKLLTSLKKLATEYKKLFVITLGSEGSLVYYKEEEMYAKSILVKDVIDTTGAGDAFAATFVKEFLTKGNIAQSLYAGNHYAAKIVQQLGAI